MNSKEIVKVLPPILIVILGLYLLSYSSEIGLAIVGCGIVLLIGSLL
jgi:hypothetical protein